MRTGQEEPEQQCRSVATIPPPWLTRKLVFRLLSSWGHVEWKTGSRLGELSRFTFKRMQSQSQGTYVECGERRRRVKAGEPVEWGGSTRTQTSWGKQLPPQVRLWEEGWQHLLDYL